MLPKEIVQLIKEEAKELCKTGVKPHVVITCTEYSLAGLIAYNTGATAWAEKMIGFTDWLYDFGFRRNKGFYVLQGGDGTFFTTTELLVYYINQIKK